MTEYLTALRAWAKGMYPTEAATELLIRGFNGQFAASGQPWIRRSVAAFGPSAPWIDFEAIPDRTGALSGGERAFLLIAASLGDSAVLVNLSDEISRLDRGHLDLVLAAVAHAAGSHQHSGLAYNPPGVLIGFTKLPSLYPWPTGGPAQ